MIEDVDPKMKLSYDTALPIIKVISDAFMIRITLKKMKILLLI